MAAPTIIDSIAATIYRRDYRTARMMLSALSYEEGLYLPPFQVKTLQRAAWFARTQDGEEIDLSDFGG